jgi:hypothetical protein
MSKANSNRVLKQYGLSEQQIKEGNQILESETKRITHVQIEKSALCSMASCALLILGAIFMWDLKKNGLFIYLAGSVLGVLAPVLGLGGLYGSLMSMFFAASAGFMCLLYFLNKKHLN